jgi:hypothetical protein
MEAEEGKCMNERLKIIPGGDLMNTFGGKWWTMRTAHGRG